MDAPLFANGKLRGITVGEIANQVMLFAIGIESEGGRQVFGGNMAQVGSQMTVNLGVVRQTFDAVLPLDDALGTYRAMTGNADGGVLGVGLANAVANAFANFSLLAFYIAIVPLDDVEFA